MTSVDVRELLTRRLALSDSISWGHVLCRRKRSMGPPGTRITLKVVLDFESQTNWCLITTSALVTSLLGPPMVQNDEIKIVISLVTHTQRPSVLGKYEHLYSTVIEGSSASGLGSHSQEFLLLIDRNVLSCRCVRSGRRGRMGVRIGERPSPRFGSGPRA